ncbi:hypothetical protein E3N88_17404 [Mikania micrantha]|uniref:Mediator complex subunit 15 KIX domain-containing protein n=1 Tax=Mikania micrantha TaxID=192012 RepID=A0A5N6NUJ0_9ASTR|nr:hypothetical protein E3N88_17404 [Mikania micrantha]
MNIGGSSSTVPEADGGNDIDADLDSWFEELLADSLEGSLMNSCVDATTITPNSLSQPFMSTVNRGANLGESSSNVSQSGTSQDMMAVIGSLTFSSSSSTTPMQSEGIISSAVKLISNMSTQSSQSQGNTDFPQYQPVPQEKYKGKAVKQPIAYPLANQSNMTLCDQMNQLQYQILSNQLLPSTMPMVVNTQTAYQQNDQASRVQMQQNLNQNYLQLQQATWSSSNLISGWQQLGIINKLNFSAPVGFAPPGEFISTTAYREYVLRQIRKMKERYNNELLKMHYNCMELRARATNAIVADNYQKVQVYLEKMMTFLNISRIDLLPKNDEIVYNYMNTVVNYVCYHMSKQNDSIRLGEPAPQPPIRPQVQPIGTMMLQNNPSPSTSQWVANLEANKSNFNNFPSSRPHPQPTQSRKQSSLDNVSFQTGLHQKPESSLRIDSFKAPQSSASTTTQQINSGPKTSSVIGSSSPISLFTNTTATNFPSRPLNHQPPVVNQNFKVEKMKAPMHKTSELTGSKPRHGMSPLCSTSVNPCPSPQFSFPVTVNPTSARQTSVPSSKFNTKKVLSPLSVASSPFLLSSSSSTPSTQYSSGTSSSSTTDSQKTKTSINPPSLEPKNSEDQVFHLTEVVKTVSSNTLLSTLSDISSMEKATNIIQDEMNIMLEHNHEPPLKMRREFNIASVHNDQFVSQGGDINSSETSTNKRMKIATKWAILEEIKETNRKLLETSINVVTDTSDKDISILGAQEGTIVKCLFKNVCFPDLINPHGQVASEKMPEFVILLLVPADYPASPPKISRSIRNELNNEPWGKLYEEMLTKFDLSLYGVTGKSSLQDMARKWDASARAVMTEFMQKRGVKSFSSMYGSWENCKNSSSS